MAPYLHARTAAEEREENRLLRYIREHPWEWRDDEAARPRLLSFEEERKKPIAMTFVATVIPAMAERRRPGDRDHFRDEFVVQEGRAMDLRMVPLILEHKLLPASLRNRRALDRIGVCLGSWTEGRDKKVLCAVYDDPDNPTVTLGRKYLEGGYSFTVSLQHIIVSFPDATVDVAVRWPLEVTLCTVPRRKGAVVEDLQIYARLPRKRKRDAAAGRDVAREEERRPRTEGQGTRA